MAIGGGSLIEVGLHMAFLSNAAVYNVWQYEVEGTFGPSSASQFGEAWWNHVKDEYRAICSANASPFRTVLVRELNEPAGAYGEYAIPTAEWSGTRPAPAGDWLPSYVGVGVRLTVDTRVTRPGQKRFSFLTESDSDGTYVQTDYATRLATLMGVMSGQMVLGDPAVGATLNPIVVRKDPATGVVTAHQNISGYIINNALTSQVSRRVGRGI